MTCNLISEPPRAKAGLEADGKGAAALVLPLSKLSQRSTDDRQYLLTLVAGLGYVRLFYAVAGDSITVCCCDSCVTYSGWVHL